MIDFLPLFEDQCNLSKSHTKLPLRTGEKTFSYCGNCEVESKEKPVTKSPAAFAERCLWPPRFR